MTKLVVFDFETTGLEPEKGDDFVQLAALFYSPGDSHVMTYSSYANPGIAIKKEASDTHGITEDLLKDQPYTGQVAREFMQHVVEEAKGRRLIMSGHNVQFDRRFLAKHVEIPDNVLWLDSYVLARRFHPEAESHKLTHCYGQVYGLTGEHKAHDALGDVRMVLELLLRMSEEQGKTLEELADACSTPYKLPLMPFGKHKGKAFSDIPPSYMRYMLSLPGMDTDTAYSMTLQLQENSLS